MQLSELRSNAGFYGTIYSVLTTGILILAIPITKNIAYMSCLIGAFACDNPGSKGVKSLIIPALIAGIPPLVTVCVFAGGLYFCGGRAYVNSTDYFHYNALIKGLV